MTMQARDVMTQNVVTVTPTDSVLKAAQLMLQNHISGLPVVDVNGDLVGVVTEGDFLRRSEIGTQRHRPKWLEFVVGPGKLAEEYVHTSGMKVEEIMTPNPHFVSESDSLETVVEVMERCHVKRLLVMREGKMVGIVSRADLMRALASVDREVASTVTPFGPVRNRILAALGKQHWTPNVNVVVRNGVVDLWGVIADERERQGLIVLVENVPGVKEVHDHLVWVEPMSGMAFASSEDDERETVGRA
jgi:CBS domain-containing protein